MSEIELNNETTIQEDTAPAKTESMDDYKDELEASFRRIQEGDILTGTVIGVSEPWI